MARNLAFTYEKLRNREYLATHKKTGRRFLVQGHPSVHKWWAHEYVADTRKGKKKKAALSDRKGMKPNEVAKPTGLVDWGSMKTLMTLVEQYIERTSKKPAIKKAQKIRRPKLREEIPLRTAPNQATPLQVNKQQHNHYVYTAPDGLKYHIKKASIGWYCWEHKSGARQKVCVGMKTREDAELELQYYLDESELPTLKKTGVITLTIQQYPTGEYLLSASEVDGVILGAAIEDEETLEAAVELEREYYRSCGYKVKVDIKPPKLLESNPEPV